MRRGHVACGSTLGSDTRRPHIDIIDRHRYMCIHIIHHKHIYNIYTLSYIHTYVHLDPRTCVFGGEFDLPVDLDLGPCRRAVEQVCRPHRTRHTAQREEEPGSLTEQLA